MTTPLARFLDEAEARLSKEPESDFQHEFLPDLERQAPLSVREAKKLVAICRAFAAVVEECKKFDQNPDVERALAAADAAVEELGKENA